MKRILLVEDDELFALDVKMKLEEAFGAVDLLHYTTAQEARFVLSRFEPDIMLLDVILEDEKSSVLLAQIAEKAAIPVIFMTAFRREDLFKMALKANPINYLQKPISQSTLKNAIVLALSHVNKNSLEKERKKSSQYILLKSKKGILEKITIADIYLLEAFGNYCHIHTPDNRFTHRMTLKTYGELVGEENFVRIQRNYVININHLESIDTKKKIVVVAGKEYSFGQLYKKDLIKKFSRLS